MNRFADSRSGYYRINGRGQTAYRSFVPVPLQDIVLNVDDDIKSLADKALEHLRQRDKEGFDRSDDEVKSSVDLAWNRMSSESFQARFNGRVVSEEGFANIPPLLLTTIDSDESKIKSDSNNLRNALDYGIGHLDKLPVSGRLIKDLHWITMQGEHNRKSYPGEFRTSPIWIGADDDSLSTAPFVPPSPDDMLKAFYDLEQYINSDNGVKPLVKAALVHYQFEVIHPFIDGNGRIGRLLVLLCLVECGILHGCTVNLSSVFHVMQFQYYAGIASVEISGTYEKWLRFFLRALAKA